MCEQCEKKDEYVADFFSPVFFTKLLFLLLFVQNSFEMYKEYDSEEEGGSCGICCKNSCRGVLESATGDLLEIARLQTATPNYKVHQKTVKNPVKLKCKAQQNTKQIKASSMQCNVKSTYK